MKFLIVKTSALGDIVHAFPVIGLLKRNFPDAQIDWVVEAPCASLVEAHPDIKRAISCNSKLWRHSPLSFKAIAGFRSFRRQLQSEQYDVLFDLQGNVKSGIVSWLARSNVKVGYSWESAAEKPNVLFTTHRYTPPSGLSIRNEYLYLCQSYLQDFSPYLGKPLKLRISAEEQQRVDGLITRYSQCRAPLFLISPGSNWQNKQLSDNSLADFLKALQHHFPCQLLLSWGTDTERTCCQQLQQRLPGAQILDRLPLPVLQNFMAAVDLVIAMDSLPLHLAATTSTATYGFFGPSLGLKYQPQGPQHHAFQGCCPYGQIFAKRCPALRTCPTGACLREANGEQLFKQFAAAYRRALIEPVQTELSPPS